MSQIEIPKLEKSPEVKEPAKPAPQSKFSAEKLLKRFDSLKSDRSTWEDHWQDLAYYCLPRRAYITTEKMKGEKLPPDVYDSTAIQSNQVLAAGLHGYFTSPAAPWFSLEVYPKEMMKNHEVKTWLADCEDKIYCALATSNFNQQIHEVYLDLGVFGTACLYEEEDAQDYVRFYARPIREIYMVEDEKERVYTVFRNFKITARQAFEKWGEVAGKSVMKALDSGAEDKELEFLHVVGKRNERDITKKDKSNMPFYSIYISKQDKKIVSEGGYEEFPFFGVRFSKESGDVYGYSPAMTIFPDIRMVNSMSLSVIKAAQKSIDPPLVLPHDGFLLPLKTFPGGINYKRSGIAGGDENRIDVIPQGTNFPVSQEMIAENRQLIQKGFFVDLFMTMSDKTMTATEVVQRTEEKIVALGSALGRMMSELLSPIIVRTFQILLRQGVIKPPPQALQQKGRLNPIYISPLAKAQKYALAGSVNAWLGTMGELAKAIPTVIDILNSDKASRYLADVYSVRPELLRNDDEVKAIRDARAQAEEMMARQQLMLNASQTAKNVGSASKDFETGKATAKGV